MITTAKGTLVKMGDGNSPEVFATIGQVKSISGPTTKADIIDVTTHSTVGFWRSKIAVLIDPGDMSFPISFDKQDATHAFATGLWYLFVNLIKRNFQVQFPNNNGLMQFGAYVSNHSFNCPVDNVLDANITLSIATAIATW